MNPNNESLIMLSNIVLSRFEILPGIWPSLAKVSKSEEIGNAFGIASISKVRVGSGDGTISSWI